MDYYELTPVNFADLRRQRLLALEADHYKLTLLLDESSDEAEIEQLCNRQNEIERRITAHRTALVTPSSGE